MSYHHRQPARIARSYGLGMTEQEMWELIGKPFAVSEGGGGAIPDIDTICLNKMYEASNKMEGDRYQVVDNLRKRTFYRTVDFDKIITGVQNMVIKAKDTLVTLRREDWGSVAATAAIDQQINSLFNRLRDGLPLQQNLNLAKTRGIEIIDAPGLWRWVEKSLMDVELAAGIIAYVACKKPAWLSVYQWLYQASLALINVAKTAASITIDLAVAAGKGILKIPDTLSTIWTYLKWGALIGGGAWLAMKVRNQARTGGWK